MHLKGSWYLVLGVEFGARKKIFFLPNVIEGRKDAQGNMDYFLTDIFTGSVFPAFKINLSTLL